MRSVGSTTIWATRFILVALAAITFSESAFAQILEFYWEPERRKYTVQQASDPNASAGVIFQTEFIILDGEPFQTVWDFGDGTTEIVNGADPDPDPHYYPAAANQFYTVSATMQSDTGDTFTVTKTNVINVVPNNESFIYIQADPFFTGAGADVTFEVIGVNVNAATLADYVFNFGDGSGNQPFEADEDIIHVYDSSGNYDITVETNDSNFSVFNRDMIRIFVTGQAGSAVSVSGEALSQTANGDAEGPAVAPNQDWMPLFYINLELQTDIESDVRIFDFSRCIPELRYELSTEAFPFGIGDLRAEDFLEWGMFEDNDWDDEGVLLNHVDELLFTWDHLGRPIGFTETEIDEGRLELNYVLDLVGNGLHDEFRSATQGGQRYIVAFRTSSVIRAGQSICVDPDAGVSVPIGFIVDCATGGLVLDEGGMPADTLPDDPIGWDNNLGYTSGMTVWDHTGEEDPRWQLPNDVDRVAGGRNLWEHPRVMYTPIPEHTRERFDLTGNFFDLVTGEFMWIREVVATENWFPLIDLNIHSSPAAWIPNVSEVDEGYRTDGGAASFPVSEVFSGLREVNVILTDIGGDPFGPPGNGGFDPRGMLGRMQPFDFSVDGDPTQVASIDTATNGVWVFHDTNNNAEFDPPNTSGATGAQLNDLNMSVETNALVADVQDLFEPGWEYIPFPPGGGDPWWKIKIPLSGDSRVGSGGWVEAIHDSSDTIGLPFYTDYFVVMRTDSGFQDVTGLPGDGTGLRPGADFRAFIEPRRFNSANNAWDGGIYLDSMQMPPGGYITSANVLNPWQNDPRWDFPNENEPWFNQRTMNQTNAKPIRAGFEVYDLGMTYVSNSTYAMDARGVDYGNGSNSIGSGGSQLGDVTFWDQWLDPFFITQSRFYDFHTVGTTTNQLYFTVFTDPTYITVEDDWLTGTTNIPYESAPFFNPTFDSIPLGPRSPFFAPPNMLNQPNTPSYDTWLPFQANPSQLEPGEYPRESDWEPQNRASRKLVQRVEALSGPLALLGINLVGTADPITNRLAPVQLDELTVAFYGDDFHPTDLLELDPNGVALSSGILLVEDTGADGTTFGLLNGDTPVPVVDLRWPAAPEPVDLDGDRVADDLDGDGDVDSADVAWVVKLKPQNRWRLPTDDYRLGGGFDTILGDDPQNPDDEPDPGDGGDGDENNLFVNKVKAPDHWTKRPMTINRDALEAKMNKVNTEYEKSSINKELPAGGKAGIDLWLYVQTSPLVTRFEQFRAFIPEYLPSRPVNQADAGIRFFPRVDRAPEALFNRDPEENPVQDWHNHEGFVINVPTALSKLTSAQQTITPDSGPVAVLAIDASTNRGFDGVVDDWFVKGQGVAGPLSFQVPSAGWGIGAMTGYFLIDSNYEQFEIVGNTDDTLTLLSGTPQNGEWSIIADPTFLEYLVVEFYDHENDGDFDFIRDILPFDIDPTVSGVALYRDNDFDPSNRNGIFDPLVDIPVQTDFAPFFIGVPGEPQNQVKLVFASPGTDDAPQAGLPRGIENQPRRRQVIPEFSGLEFSQLLFPQEYARTEQYQGPEFFVVIRTSANLEGGDDFRVAISSWGPPTPSGPDPDTFPPPPLAPQDEFDIFQEFPWGSQAVGYVTMFRDPPDLTGFRFMRTTIARDRVTDVITATTATNNVDAVTITSVTPQILPPTIDAESSQLTIFGTNFGTSPIVIFEGVQLVVTSATSTRIDAIIPVGLVITPPVSLTVTNPTTGSSATRNDLFAVGDVQSPRLLSVDPPRGNASVFPVTLTGRNFFAAEVFFDEVQMVVEPGGTDTLLRVSMPNGGLPTPGPYDVTVRATVIANGDEVTVSSTLPNGFIFENPAGGGGNFGPLSLPVPCFIATAAYGSSQAGELEALRGFRDEWLMQSAVGRMAIDGYYSISPAIADTVAKQPVLAAWVRVVLAMAQAWPVIVASLMMVSIIAARRRIRQRRAQV